ncbi:MAG: metal-dependent hydrolase [Bryobacter sp.]|nr:metal-dependent hydrolase [Bryobacter sp.]
MDPFTHSLCGLVLGQSGPKRWTPSAAWIALVASNLPDFDSVFQPFHDIRHLVWHRHFTHSLCFAPLLALASVAVVHYVFRRPVAWRGAFGLALLCVLAHLGLDLLTIWKVKIGLPFTSAGFSLQTQWMVDPILLILFAAALAIPFLSHLVSGEIGAKRGSGALTARLAWVVIAAWFILRFNLHATALEELRSRVYEGAPPRRVEAWPSPHPLRFTGLVETERAIYVLPVNLLEYVDPETAQAYFKPVFQPAEGRAAQAAAADSNVQTFLAWAQWPRWQVFEYEGERPWVVIVEEIARESANQRPRVVVTLDRQFRVIDSKYEAAAD